MADRANAEFINSFRRPKIIATTAYLNDPIEFERDARFDLESALQEADPDFPICPRDDAEFVVVELNGSAPQFYPVEMYRDEVNSTDFLRVMDRKRQIQALFASDGQ